MLEARIAPWLGDLVELAENLLLDLHILEHRLDDQIAIGQRIEIQTGAEQPHACFDIRLRHAALLGGAFIVAADRAEAAIQRFPCRFHDRDRNSGVEKIHRNAAAHRAGADDADFPDRQRRRVVRYVGDLPRLALGKKHVTLGARLIGGNEIDKSLALELHAFVERQVDGGLDGPDRRFPGFEAAEFAGVVAANFLEYLRLAARRFDLVVEIADFAQRHLRVDDLAGESERAVAQFSLVGQRVDDAPLERLPGAERRSRQDGVERIFNAAQTRQPLRSAGAGNEAELDLRQAEFCRRYRDPVMADQSRLEAATQRRAMNGGDDGLRAALQRGLDFRHAGAFRRFAEFRNVGAGDEGAAGANQHDGFHGRIGGGLSGAVAQTIAHLLGERVDGR